MNDKVENCAIVDSESAPDLKIVQQWLNERFNVLQESQGRVSFVSLFSPVGAPIASVSRQGNDFLVQFKSENHSHANHSAVG